MTTERLVDVAIVGAGPIGLEVGVVLQRAGFSVHIFDRGPVGATIVRTFPPQTRFFTSPERLAIRGYQVQAVNQEKVTGEEFLSFLRTVAAREEIPISTFTSVDAVSGQDGDFTLATRHPSGAEQQVRARKIVFATGGTDRSRRLGVPGEDLPHVSSILADPHRYFQRRVAVVGGRNSAAESALRLYRVGAEVTLIHRRPDLHDRVKFWIRPEVEALMSEGLIKRVMPAEVVEIGHGRLRVRYIDTGVSDEVLVDDVLCQIGFVQDQTLLSGAGIDFDESEQAAPIHDPLTMESNLPGVFVVGTATAGTQGGFGVFIENCHQHADRVLASLTGQVPPVPVAARPLPET